MHAHTRTQSCCMKRERELPGCVKKEEVSFHGYERGLNSRAV